MSHSALEREAVGRTPPPRRGVRLQGSRAVCASPTSRGSAQVSRAVAVRPTPARLALACLELTKPRIMTLVILTGVPALLAAARGLPRPGVFWGALAGTALASGSASAFNHYFDRDIDALMVRTARRPLPSGLLAPWSAWLFGMVLAALSWAVLATFTNLFAALLGLVSIFYYAVVYTVWLKRSTPENIVIGGGAGAAAPLIAWAAVTGHLSAVALLQASIVFLWTPPHFWALALYRSGDYQAAGIPMLPVTHGRAVTRRRILLYSLALVAASLSLQPLGAAGWPYTLSAALLGAGFLRHALRLYRNGAERDSVKLFRFSIAYLFLLFAAMAADAALRSPRG
ncbi:MAG TPA: heme o synthase [Candidatus Saccharimonadales bacterium]|nr:heme o synthase [Candidatus Saccharimonadales bacterium]